MSHQIFNLAYLDIVEPKFQLYSAGIKWSPLEVLRQKAEIVISVAFGIILTKVSFATSFIVISYPLVWLCPLKHFLVDKET